MAKSHSRKSVSKAKHASKSKSSSSGSSMKNAKMRKKPNSKVKPSAKSSASSKMSMGTQFKENVFTKVLRMKEEQRKKHDEQASNVIYLRDRPQMSGRGGKQSFARFAGPRRKAA